MAYSKSEKDNLTPECMPGYLERDKQKAEHDDCPDYLYSSGVGKANEDGTSK